jgi:hypothetical protein
MHNAVCDAISPARLAPYVSAAAGDVAKALVLYRWNQDIAGSFLRPLCNLEITLRNNITEQMESLTTPRQWWEHPAITRHPKVGARLSEGMARLAFDNRPLVRDNLIPEMSFGFWVGLLSSQFDTALWRRGLYQAFPHFHGARRELRATFQIVLNLRNRIGHHEPIYHRHLAADRVTIHKLLGYLSPEMRVWSLTDDPLPGLIADRPVPRQRPATP